MTAVTYRQPYEASSEGDINIPRGSVIRFTTPDGRWLEATMSDDWSIEVRASHNMTLQLGAANGFIARVPARQRS